MKERDRHMLAEMFFTACILCSAAFLTAGQLSFYFPLLAIGLAAGFIFSWLTRNKVIPRLNIIIGLSAVAVLLWLVYSALNSSFIYREVVVLCMKRMIVLIILLSFNACSPRVLADMQILSLPLFLSHAVWLRQYSGIDALMVLAYLVSGLIVLKIQFQGLFNSASRESFQRDRSFFILVLFFLCSIAAAWVFASNYNKANLAGGVLPEAGRGGNVQVETLDKQYYELQDKLQKQMQGLMSRSGAVKDKQDAFAALSVLLNGGGEPLDLDKAGQALEDFIQGSADPEGDALAALESSLDKKIAANSGKIRDDINTSLKRNPFNIKDRLDILSQVNKLAGQESSKTLSDTEKRIQETIQKTSLDPGIKKDIGGSVAALKDWEAMALYRKNNRSVKSDIERLKKGLKEDMSGLLEKVNKARDPLDPAKIAADIEKLEKSLAADQRKIIEKMKETLDLRSEMIISEGVRRSKEKIKSSGLPGEDRQGLEKGMDDLRKSADARDFLKKHGELTKALEAGELQSDKTIESSVRSMLERISGQKEKGISSSLEQSKLPDGGQKIMKPVRDMASARTGKELDSSADKAKAQVEAAREKGFISEDSANGLKNDIDELSGLIKAQKGFDLQGKQDRSRPENESQAKADSMASARTKPELDSAAAKANDQIEAGTKNEGASKYAGDSIQDRSDNGEDIRSKMESISEALSESRIPDGGEKVMESVRDMASAKTGEELGLAADKAQEQVGDAGQKGFVSEEAENGLAQDIEDLNLLLEEGLDPGQRESQGEASAEDYQQSMLSSIKGSPLAEDEQKVFSGLTEELFKAQTISRMDSLQAEVDAQARSLGQSASKKEWAGKFAGDFQEMKSLRKMIKTAEKNDKLKDKLEKMQGSDPENAEGLGEQWESIVKSKTDEDMEKEIKVFSDAMENNRNIPPKVPPKDQEKKADFQIDLLPRRVVMLKGGYVSLRPVAVYGGTYVRDVRAELEWFSRDPGIASVDQKGGVTALSAGDTVVFCRHKGVESQKTKVKVTAEIADDIYGSLKSELKK
jgi:hypothetical protein